MNSWDKKISIRLLKSIALCFFFANIHAEEKNFIPSLEVNPLDTIKLNFDIPIIDASNALVSFSSFEDLLVAHITSLPSKANTLTWEVKTKKNQLPLPSIDSKVASEKFTSKGYWVDPLATTEETKKNYVQKNFFDDIISNLKEAKDHQNIRAIFYPDDRVTYIDDLEERLNSSLEFKVLTFTKTKEFVTNISKEDASLKKLQLAAAVIIKDPMALSPHKSNLFEEKRGLYSEELYKQEQYATTWQEEESLEVEYKALALPEILTEIVNVYTYRPDIFSETFDVKKIQLPHVEKKPLKTSSVAFQLEVSDKPFVLNPLIIVVVDEKEFPTPLSFTYLTPLSAKKIEEKKVIVNKYCFNTDPKSAAPSLPVRIPSTIQKTFLVEPYQNLLSTGNLASIESREFDKNGEPIEHNTPFKEDFSKSNLISLPLILKKDGTTHEFTPNSLVYIPKDHLRKKGYYASIRDPSISDQKRLNEFPGEVYDQKIRTSEYLAAFYLEEKVSPEKEQVENTKPLSLILVKGHKKNPIDGSVAFYPLEQNQPLPLSESELGHLLENIHAVFSKGLPDYTKDEKLAKFVNRSLNIGGDQREKQKAINITFKMPYKKLHSTQIKSSIQPKIADPLHPFDAEVSHVEFFDQMERIDDAIIAEKGVIAIETPINYSKEEELVIATNDLKEVPPFQILLPYSSKNIFLQDQLSINNAEFRGELSLPKLTAINKENSFFLNPMLSLIDSTEFNEDYTQSGDPSLVNRNNRMTQYFLFNLPSLDELHTDSFPEAFNLETRMLLGDSQTANDFSCTIKTFEKSILEPLPVHILYILDTSSSIEPHRFGIFKEAIVSSLEQLDINSTFNIAILSKGKVEMLHEQNPHPTTSSKGYVKRYLRKITQSSQTSFKDLVSLLEKEKITASKEMTHRSCLILSDGKFANNIRIDRKLLQNLTAIEAGNFSIYTASVSDNNNTAMLSLLAKLNHGFSLYTRTHSSFSRKFSILLKHIKHPLIHDVMISFPDDDGALAYVSDQVSPILLADKDFTFYGNSKSGKNSRVFIQGRCGNRWINILKDLPLKSARKGRPNLKKKLVTQKSILSLQSFVDTKDEHYLLQAKEFGKEFNVSLPVP